MVNDFSVTGIVRALSANGLAHKRMFADIGIMQKLTTRVENGEIWYYTGAYSGYFNCIIRSRDFITWDYVAKPDFINLSQWKNAVYVWGDRCYYFVRQVDCQQGFLTYYDLNTGIWTPPCLVRDVQSRSDFIAYAGELYLIHAPRDRNGFGILRVDREQLKNSRPVAVADMQSSCFYPFARVEEDTVYLSYTVDRQHIRLLPGFLRRAKGQQPGRQKEQVSVLLCRGAAVIALQYLRCQRCNAGACQLLPADHRRLRHAGGQCLLQFRQTPGAENEFSHIHGGLGGIPVYATGIQKGNIPRLHGKALSVLGQNGAALKQHDDLHLIVQVRGKADPLIMQDLRLLVILLQIVHGARSIIDIFVSFIVGYDLYSTKNDL